MKFTFMSSLLLLLAHFITTPVLAAEPVSFVMQLTDESEYEGGEVQVMDSTGELYSVPRERGAVIIFDSRLTHRVRKVRSGIRKSLVGWAVGPRWR